VVRAVGFQGNRSIPDEALRVSIATSQSAWFARSPLVSWLGLGEKRYLNETEFRRDVLRIVALYRQSGYLEAGVDTIVRRSERGVHIAFIITEGEPVVVDSVGISGHEEVIATGELAAGLPLRVGEPFNRLLMLASADSIRLRLANRGYPFAEVYRNFDVDRAERSAVLKLAVDPGPPTRIGDIAVEGLDDVDESVVRRSLSLEPGRLFRLRDLYESQSDLYRTELFSYVNVGIADSAATADSLVDVHIRVAEGPRHRVRLGGGYGTIDCFRALASYSYLNFLGGGRQLQVQGRTSKIGVGEPLGFGLENSLCPALAKEEPSRLKLNYNLSATVLEPHLFSRRTRGTLTLFAERFTEYLAYLREAFGGEVGVGYDVTPRVPVTLAYGLSWGSTQADPATFCALLNVCQVDDAEFFGERRRRSVITLAAVRERRNSILNPTRGSWVAGELVWASPTIGSDTLVQFTKGTVEFAGYRSITERSVLSVRLQLGTILPATLSGSGGDVDYVPTEDRFYAGGANTVRGYGQNELGPVVRVLEVLEIDSVTSDSIIRTSPTGGTDLLVMNIEYRFPLPGVSKKLSGAIFVDAGRVRDRIADPEGAPGLRVTPGVGLRLSSPLGPIRLDFAFNPYPPDDGVQEFKQDGSDLIELHCEENGSPVPCLTPAPDFFSRWRIHLSVGQPF
jgi:outer membrane protein assembly factor BamA